MLRLARSAASGTLRRSVQSASIAPAAVKGSAIQRCNLPPRRLFSGQPLPPPTPPVQSATAAAVPAEAQPPHPSSSSASSDSQQPPPPPRRSWVRVGLLTALGLVGVSSAGLMYISNKLEPTHPLREGAGNLSTFSNALLRLWRDVYCTVRIVADYELSLRNIQGEERERVLEEVHWRSAKRLRDLMRTNGGVYIKFGQHIAQLQYLLPDAYVFTMQPMLNQAPTSSIEEVERVFREEFGKGTAEVFESFDPVPVASASLAQVHFATLPRTNPSDPPRHVAVKIQHAALQANCDSDIATVRFIIQAVHKFDKRFDYTWLADEMSVSLPLECNFTMEAKNSERARRNLQCDRRSDVNVPRIEWSLTSKRVLTMEKMEGCKVSDVASLKQMGVDLKAVSTLLAQVSSEMIFLHGFVHCDLHAGNVLVQRRSAHDPRPRLILLDHGLYKELDEGFRLSYAHLWQSLIRGDKEGIRRYAQEMHAGEMYPLFVSVLTRKSFEDITKQKDDLGALVLKNDESERGRLQAFAVQHAEDVQTILAKVPRPLLLLLKTNDCLRSIDSALGAPVNSFIIMASYCTRAINQHRLKHSTSPFVWLAVSWDTFSMECRLSLYSFMRLQSGLKPLRSLKPKFLQKPVHTIVVV